MLTINRLTVQFGGLTAVNDLSFEVPEGQIYSLIGPNGAGKTTVFNAISRFYPAKGEILFQGINLLKLPAHQIVTQGIARTFQNIELFHGHTVLDNLLVAQHHRLPSGFLAQSLRLPGVRRDERQARERAQGILAFLQIENYAKALIEELSLGTLKVVELARALVMNPKLLLLDEPVAGMNPEESQHVSTIIRNIRDTLGITILLVEHDMSMVMSISDNILVMNFGKRLCEGTPDFVRNHPEVIEAYLGKGHYVAEA